MSQAAEAVGLRKGSSLDIRTGHGFNELDVRKRAWQLIKDEDPSCVIGSPDCRMFCAWLWTVLERRVRGQATGCDSAFGILPDDLRVPTPARASLHTWSSVASKLVDITMREADAREGRHGVVQSWPVHVLADSNRPKLSEWGCVQADGISHERIPYC